MKVVQICTNVMSGSVGKIVRDLYVQLVNEGNDCLICYGRGTMPEGYQFFKFDNTMDIYSHVILARLFDSDGLHSKIATRRLISRLEEYKPDVVHIHCLHGYYINYPLLFEYLKKSKVKVVWTMHDCWAYTGHCAYYSYQKCLKWRDECSNCPQVNTYPKSLFIDNSKRNYRKKRQCFTSLEQENLTIVTPSVWLLKEMQNSFLHKYRSYVINNGISKEKFQIIKKLKNLGENKIILGVANIWDKRKGLDDFVELSKVLPKDTKIMIVGASEKQIAYLKGFGIEAIERTQSVEDLVKLYNQATVLFNPTYEDNYPTVNIEAIACGLPVVTYRTGGSPELIDNTKQGIVIKERDFSSLLAYVNKLEKNIEDNEWHELYADYMASEYIEVYKAVIENRGYCDEQN